MVHINYHNITHDDMNNGDGLRVVLWLSGCSHHCYNCQNPQTWNPDSGIQFDESEKQEIFNELSMTIYQALLSVVVIHYTKITLMMSSN